MQCPNETELGFFIFGLVNDPARREAIADHLEECDACQACCAKLPKPPRRILGRPVPQSDFIQDTFVVEGHIRSMIKHLTENFETGKVIKIAGDWKAQGMVYKVCAIVSSRLQKQKRTCAFLGTQLIDADAPKPGTAEFEFLLDAPTFRNLDDWLRANISNQVRILAGDITAWDRLGHEADVLLEVRNFGNSSEEEVFSSYFADLRIAAEFGTPAQKAGVLMSALNTDIPQDCFGNEPAANPFVQLTDADYQLLPYYSTQGTWLAAEFIRRQPPELVERLRQELDKQKLPESIRERLRFQ